MAGHPHQHSGKIFDGAFFGVIVSTAFCSINLVQGWTYMNENSDKWPLRFLVILLLILDTIRTAIDIQIVHYFLIKNFGNVAAIDILSVTVNVNHALVVIIVFFAQLHFVHRVYMLYQKKLWIPAMIAISATVALVTGLVSVAGVVGAGNSINAIAAMPMRIRVGIGHSFATIADIVTTIALVVKFSAWEIDFKRTRTLLHRLVLYTITRGLLVTMVQVIFLVTYQIASTQIDSIGLDFCLSKVYTMTLITMLNSRNSLRSHLDNPTEVTASALIYPDFARGSNKVTGPFIKVDMNPITEVPSPIRISKHLDQNNTPIVVRSCGEDGSPFPQGRLP